MAALAPGALADLLAQRGDRVRRQPAAEGVLGEHLAAGVEQDHRRTDERRERRDEIVDPALGEDDLLEPLLRGERSAQNRVLLVDELGERASETAMNGSS